MRKIKQVVITNEPFKSIVDEEWKRAKQLLPLLGRKPWVMWATSEILDGAYGNCSRREVSVIRLHRLFQEVNDTTHFRLAFRHEICHMLKPSRYEIHGSDFKWWLNRLEGSRFVAGNLRDIIANQ